MSINLMTLIISLSVLALCGFSFFYYRKNREARMIEERYLELSRENRALLQQLTVIRGDKAYEGIHLKEVQQAFDELDQTLIKLRSVCKIKPHDIDNKLKKWQGSTPIDEISSDLYASQIKISFSTNVGIEDKENNVDKNEEEK